MKSSRRVIACILSASLALSLSACLKTRAQVKEDHAEDTAAAETPSQPKEVQPQGDYVVDEIKTEITRLNGRIEDLERSQKQNASNGPTKEEMKKLDDRIIELEQSQADMIEVIKKLQSAPAAAAADPSAALEKGRKQLEARDYEGAIASLSAFTKANPKKNADEGYFLLGEAHFGAKDYKKAIVNYSKLTEKYTRSSHMPAALLKIALSFEAMGMKDDAKAFYQELVDKFPKSPEARKARAKAH